LPGVAGFGVEGGAGVPDSLLMFGKYYVSSWRVNVVYTSQTNVPVTGKWGDIAEEPLKEPDVFKLYHEAVRQLGGPPPRIAIVTGPYQDRLDADFYSAVLDIDELGQMSREEKAALEVQLAREGLVVVSTPRGIHLHFRLPRSRRVYAFSLVRETEEGKLEKVGEGASLQKHLWTSPPSRRAASAGGGFHTYSFVLPSGERLARYDHAKLRKLEPPLATLEEVGEVLESYLGYRIVAYSPEAGAAPGGLKFKGEEVGLRVKPLFRDLEDFHARIHNYPLPAPVARILFNYYRAVGAEVLADALLARNPALVREQGPIPRGSRFLAAAEFALFVAHMVAFARYRDIMEMLQHGVEDFPADEGAPLDRKLRYLFLYDEETGEYVYPRYSGLGAMRPVAFCGECLWRGECDARGAAPWKHLRRLARRMALGMTLQAQRPAPASEAHDDSLHEEAE